MNAVTNAQAWHRRLGDLNKRSLLVNSWLLGKRCCIIEQLPF